jgi:heme exporter protein A
MVAGGVEGSGTAARFAGDGIVCRRGEREVLAGLSFQLAAGEAMLLTGRNGAGKSSLLRLMAGLLPPAGGVLSWNETNVTADPAAHRARVSFVGDRDAVKPGLSVAGNLAAWASLLGADEATTVPAALGRFGLAALADLPARYLSAGQRRRLALARLLLTPRPLWLLDEPHAGLDAASTKSLEDTVRAHRSRGGMAVVASHGGLDLPDARILALAA